MLNRLAYEWDVHCSPSLGHLRKLFQETSVELDLVTAGVIKGDLKGLRRFHEEVIDVIAENEDLQTALYSLHNENIDEIGPIISEMICSRVFASTFCGDKLNDIPTLKSKEKIITAYLQGRYGHYRGRTSEYPVADIAIVNSPGVSVSGVVLPIHMLTFLLNRENELDGVDAELVRGFFPSNRVRRIRN